MSGLPLPRYLVRRRQTAVLAVAVLGLALCVRSLVLDQMLDSPWSADLILDERITHLQALSFAGEGESRATPPLEFPPVPAFVASVLYRLLGPDPALLRLQSFVCGVVAAALVLLLVRRLSPQRLWPAVAAACFVALHGPSILNATVCLKTTLVAVLLVGAGLALQSRSGWLALIAGALFAAAFFSQGQTLPFVFAGAWALFRHRRRLLGFVIGVVLVTAPACLVQAGRGAGFPWLPVQAGTNFYFSNQPGSTVPVYQPTPFASSAPELQIPEMHLVAEERTGRSMTAQEADAYWRDEALRGMAGEPMIVLKRLFFKAAVTFLPHENCDHYSLATVAADVPLLRAPWPSSTWVLVLAVLLAPAAWRSRRCRPLVLGLLGSLLLLVLTAPTARYRTVLIPVAAVVAAVGAGRVRRPRRGLVVILLAGTAALLPITIPGDDDTAAKNARGLVLERVGRVGEAQRMREESRAQDGLFSDFARLQLAQGLPPDQARALLDEVPVSSFAAGLADSARCGLYAHEGGSEAEEQCARAFRLRPASVDACRGWAAQRREATASARCDELFARLRLLAPFAFQPDRETSVRPGTFVP